MVSSDTIVGIVGAVILTGAMIAVFYYEADRGDSGAPGDLGEGAELFDFRYTENEHALVDGESATLGEGDSEDYQLDVPAFSFMIHIEVDWQEHDVPQLAGDPAFTIEVLDRDDDDAVVDSEENTSPLHVEMSDDKSAPERMNFTVAADNEAAAQETVDEHMESDEVLATERNWTVRVTLDDDGIDDATGQISEERTFDITVRISHYVPELVEDTE